MESQDIVNCNTSVLELPARSTFDEAIPDGCWNLIWARSGLVHHYKGWECLMKPHSLTGSPFSSHWFLKVLKVICHTREVDDIIEDDDVEHITSSNVLVPAFCVKHSCLLELTDLGLDKKQILCLHLKDGTEWTTRIPHSFCDMEVNYTKTPVAVGDKGLLFLNLHECYGNRVDKFIVMNPVNNSIKLLPPVPFSLCNCRWSCCCSAAALKLIVYEGQSGCKGPFSSSYKAFVLETKILPRRFQLNIKDYVSRCRVIVYDSVTNLWARTGMQWIGYDFYPEIFSRRNGIFYVFEGRDGEGYTRKFNREMLHKFQCGSSLGKVKTPWNLKRRERYCNDHDESDSWYTFGRCGCISSAVFEAQGKMFYFQQISGPPRGDGISGPTCICANVWELDDRTMSWSKVCELPFHKFEISKQQPKGNMTFQYEEILIVVHDLSSTRRPGGARIRSTEGCGIAGFNVVTKTWCKVPTMFLENPQNCRESLNGLVFQPDADTRA